MVVGTEILKEAYKTLDQVPAIPGLLSSQFIRLRTSTRYLQLNLTGLVFSEIRVAAEGIESEWIFFLDRRVFGGFLEGVQGEKVTITKNKDQITLKSGRQIIDFSPVPEISGYQKWERSPKARTVKLSKDLRRDLSMLAHYAPDLAALDHLSAVYLMKGKGLVATDSMTLASCQNVKLKEELMLPAGLAKILQSFNAEEIEVEPQGVGVIANHGYLYQGNSQKLTSAYPKETVSKVIAEGMQAGGILKPQAKELCVAVEYLNGFVGFGAGTDAAIVVTLQKGNLKLALKLPSGVVEKTIPTALLKDFQDSWQIAQLVPWIRYIADEPEKVIHISKNTQGFQFFRCGSSLLAMISNAS